MEHFPEPVIIEKERVFDGYFKIDRAVLMQPGMQKGTQRKVTRFVFERGDAAGILLYDSREDKLLLVRQFRYPPFVRGHHGWLLEIVAGTVSSDADAVEVARKEIFEEAGISISRLLPMGSFFLSPGGSSERCFLFRADVDTRGLHGRICGEVGTSEEVRVELVSLSEALEMIETGDIVDAKTIIAVLELRLRLTAQR